MEAFGCSFKEKKQNERQLNIKHSIDLEKTSLHNCTLPTHGELNFQLQSSKAYLRQDCKCHFTLTLLRAKRAKALKNTTKKDPHKFLMKYFAI